MIRFDTHGLALIFSIAFSAFSVVALSAQEPTNLDTLRKAFDDATPDGRELATADLLNGRYRELPADQVVRLLVPLLRVPEQDQRLKVSQGLLMEHLSRAYAEQAGAAMPDLLRHIRNPEVDSYLRASAIDAAARIAPGNADVVGALIESIENGEPRSTSQVLDRCIAVLGEMGRPAHVARPTLRGLLDHHFHTVQDHAFEALGKLATDERPLTMEESLVRIADWSEQTPDELAAALLYFATWSEKRATADRAEQRAVRIRALVARSESPRDIERAAAAAADAEEARASALLPQEHEVRAALHKLIAKTPNNYQQRAAISALIAIGPGSDPEVVGTLLEAMFDKHSSHAEQALPGVDGQDVRAVPLLLDALEYSLENARETDSTGRRTDRSWHQPVVISNTLARFGPAARDAGPILADEIHALAVWQSPSGADRHQVQAYLTTLGAIGEPTDHAIDAILAVVIDAPPPATTGGVPWQKALQSEALLTLRQTGLPVAGPRRTKTLEVLRRAMLQPATAAAATDVVTRLAPQWVDAEAAPFVEPLIALVRADDTTDDTTVDGEANVHVAEMQERALSALTALGPRARPALALLRSIAGRPVPEPSFRWEVHQELMRIRAAREAIEAISAGPDVP